MNETDLLQQLNAIFREELGDDSISLTPATVAGDVAGWTSLTHILLVAAVEEKFGVRFNTREIMQWKNVGDLMGSLAAKQR